MTIVREETPIYNELSPLPDGGEEGGSATVSPEVSAGAAPRVTPWAVPGVSTEVTTEKPAAPRRKKVAIVGGGPTRAQAPYKKKDWEIWAFSSSKYRYRRVDRWFEIHHLKDLRQQLAGRRRGRRTFKGYMKYMRRLKCPVYMMKRHRKIPRSVKFPKDELIKEFGPCFTSTASWLVGLDIMEGYETIGLWGINPRGPEYRRQRAALRYLLSVAKRRGIRLVFPKGFSIRIPKKAKPVRTRVLYAYGWKSKKAWWRDRVYRRLRRERLRRLRRKVRRKLRRRVRRVHRRRRSRAVRARRARRARALRDGARQPRTLRYKYGMHHMRGRAA